MKKGRGGRRKRKIERTKVREKLGLEAKRDGIRKLEIYSVRYSKFIAVKQKRRKVILTLGNNSRIMGSEICL